MLASEVLATALIVLYPVELAVEFRIEHEDVAGILHYLLQARTRAWEVILCRKDCSSQNFPPCKHCRWETRFVFLPSRVRVINLAVQRKPHVSGC